jgi:hypothetical protein
MEYIFTIISTLEMLALKPVFISTLLIRIIVLKQYLNSQQTG